MSLFSYRTSGKELGPGVSNCARQCDTTVLEGIGWRGKSWLHWWCARNRAVKTIDWDVLRDAGFVPFKMLGFVSGNVLGYHSPILLRRHRIISLLSHRFEVTLHCSQFLIHLVNVKFVEFLEVLFQFLETARWLSARDFQVSQFGLRTSLHNRFHPISFVEMCPRSR